MPLELYWDDDARTTMLLEVRGAWTWDELLHTMHTIKQVTDRAEREIAAILDLGDGLRLPGGTWLSREALDVARKLLALGQGGTGQVIVVGVSPAIRGIYNTLLTMDRRLVGGVAFAATVDEARAILASRRNGNTPGERMQ
ncbi:MAG: hypothetical protein NZM00_12080 [Anaerolinea sp.]|nr:hypothetical protein [Anaerolinea sp.]